MAAARAVWWAFLLCAVLLLLDFSSCDILLLGTTNGTVTLAPSVAVDFKEIIWKKEKDKVVQWESGLEVKSYPPFERRVQLDTKLGNLVISNLTSSDEGEYEIESPNLRDGVKFSLKIFDPLPSPTLHCTLSNDSIEITCEIPESYRSHLQELEHRWHCPFPQCSGFLPGIPSLLRLPMLHLRKDNVSQEVECIIRNLESNMASTINLSTCVSGAHGRTRYALIGVVLVAVITVIGFLSYARKTESTNPT